MKNRAAPRKVKPLPDPAIQRYDYRLEQLEKLLKPCPCCKNPTPGLIDLTIRDCVIDEDEPAEVECGCGIYAWGGTVAEAIERWNTRKRSWGS